MNVKNIKGDPWLMSAEAWAIYAQCMFKATFEEYQQEIAEIAAKQECSISACLHNGQFAGIITLKKISDDTAEIIGIAVKKEFQRCGIGKFLIRSAALELGVNFLTAETDDGSVGFYKNSGFAAAAFIRHFPDADVTRYNCVLDAREQTLKTDNIEIIAQNNLEKALQVIEKSGIRQAWESIGATVNQVGSMTMGLLMKHRDIDFHIYTDKLDIAESFKALQKICTDPAVTSMEYRNLADTEEACLEFHLWYMLDNEEWQIDMIQILKGSQFDGYFEHIAERIKAVLTPETRRTILELKFLTPDDEHIMGIEYYQAVIADGVRSYPEFIEWRENHPVNGIISWCP